MLYYMYGGGTMLKVIIIIPAYNESESILKTIKDIDEYNAKSKIKYDYIVINDGSTDNEEQILKDNNIPHIELIENLGIGGAVQTGYKYAYYNNYDIAVQFDGDGQHDIRYVKDIIMPIEKKEADLVIGSRFIKKEEKNFQSTFFRRIGINLISYRIKRLTGKKIYDTTSGFRAINKDIIKLFNDDYPTEYPEPVSEVKVLKHNYKIKEVPVIMHERLGGTSSIHSWKKFYYMINVFIAMNIERKGK